ncbi:uncharacterized protein LOC133197999 isoform X2 [Saccostrea echinata]|uniref:uncharacterized protein LOC133197999 isoform X2 n=1 Tax=Saccostrea echinata TaxID=191078 RepID=UPI002A82A5C6|nr:uncharacterized protein LOC133197999 isoform X2 [Saccostrea echinata]
MFIMGDKSDDDLDEIDLSEKIKQLEREKERLERRNMKKKYAELSRSVGQLRRSTEYEPHSSSISPSRDKNHPNRAVKESVDNDFGSLLSEQRDRLRMLQRQSGECASGGNQPRGRDLDQSDSDSEERRNLDTVMSKEHKQKLQLHRDTLVENMTPEDIFNDLIASQVISTADVSRIKEKMTREAMNEELLNNLIRRSDRAYYEFVKSLRKTLQGHLADLLDESSTRQRRTPKRKRQTGEINIAVDVEDISPAPGRKKPTCSCGEVEEQILIMAKTAYKAIRRRDNTPASFEQFKKELSQTNEIVKESMEIMHTLKILCKHGDLDISYGSVIFSIRCNSLMCIQEIWMMYKSGSLQSLLQRTFVTRSLLRICSVKSVRLRVQISETEYKKCLREIGGRESKTLKSCRVLRSASQMSENVVPQAKNRSPYFDSSSRKRKAFTEIEKNTCDSPCTQSQKISPELCPLYSLRSQAGYT